MESNTFISPGEVIADVARRCGDPGFRWMSYGYYDDLVKRALTEISFDTLCDEQSYDFAVPSDNIVHIPFYFFNIKEVWVGSGTRKTKLWFKPNFVSDRGSEYARIMDRDRDNVLGSHADGREDSAFYYTLRNGKIVLSKSCSAFSTGKILLNGILNANEKTAFIPMLIREGITDWAVVKGLEMRLPEDIRTFGSLYNIAKQSLNGERNPPFDGSWFIAQERLTRLDSGARKDILEYMGSIVYK